VTSYKALHKNKNPSKQPILSHSERVFRTVIRAPLKVGEDLGFRGFRVLLVCEKHNRNL